MELNMHVSNSIGNKERLLGKSPKDNRSVRLGQLMSLLAINQYLSNVNVERNISEKQKQKESKQQLNLLVQYLCCAGEIMDLNSNSLSKE
jgi:hypothetical protein